MTDIEAIGAASLDTVVELDSKTNGSRRRDFFAKRFTAQEKHPDSFISLGASDGESMVGFVCCHMLKGEFGSDELIAVLDAMSVEPESQGHGVGHELMSRLMTEIRSRGGRELQTQAGWKQPEVLDFFASTGFKMAPRLILERSTPDFSDPTRDEFDDLSRDEIMVRSLLPEDLDKVIRIDGKITGHARRDFFNRKFEEVLYESGVRISLIAEMDGMVVGFMMARVDFGEFGRTASEAVIDTLGVDTAFRSKHVGHALLAQLLGNLATLQVDSVRSEVEWNNHGLLGFLGRCGFEPSQRLALSCGIA
jgi:ribosomal protein S18 acetylase RimI-like enzyme